MTFPYLTSLPLLLACLNVVNGINTTTLCRDFFPLYPRTSAQPCLKVKLSPGGVTNSLVILIELIEYLTPGCDTLVANVTVALQVVNELGYPCGRVQSSFTRYEDGLDTFCKLGPDFDNQWATPSISEAQCIFYPPGEQNYLQPVNETDMPTILSFDILLDERSEMRVVWVYKVPRIYFKGPFPKEVWVVGEILDYFKNIVYSFTSEFKARVVTVHENTEHFDFCTINPTMEVMTDPPTTPIPKELIDACIADYGKCSIYDKPDPVKETNRFFSCRGWRLDVERVLESKTTCLRLVAAHTRQKNKVMVGLIKVNTGECRDETFDVEDFVVQANNENGYPVGTILESFSFGSSGDIYGENKCVMEENSDGRSELPDEEKNYPCFFHKEGKDKYIQEVDEVNVPTLYYAKPALQTSSGKSIFVSVWQYSQENGYSGLHPTKLIFTAEAYLPNKKRVFVLKSQATLDFKYDPKAKINQDPNSFCFGGDKHDPLVDDGKSKVDANPGYIDACKAAGEKCHIDFVTPTPTPTGPPKPPGPPPSPGAPEVIDGLEPPPTIQPLKKTRLKLGNVYEGCLQRTKGCIVPPKGQKPRECLKFQTCQLVIAFQRQDVDVAADDVVVIEMYHVDPGAWFAIGINFSPDEPKMSKTFVIECVDEGTREGPVIYNSRNLPARYENIRYYEDGPEGASKIIKKQETYRRGRELYCRFHLSIQFSRTVTSSTPEFIDLHRKPVYVIAAWGSDFIAGPSGNLRQHKPGHTMKPHKSKKSVLSARYAPNSHQKTFLFLHGSFMTWAFVFCLPVAIFSARFLKETFSSVKICRRIPLWLFLHVFLTTLSIALVSAGVAEEIYGHMGWTSLRPSGLHTYIGGATGGLLILNFFGGFFVKTTRYGERNLSGLAHSILGHLTQLGAATLMVRTEDVSFGDAPCRTKYIVGAWIFSLVVTHFVMGYHYCWVDWIVGLKKRRSIAVTPIGVLTEEEVGLLLERSVSRQVVTRNEETHVNPQEVISAPGAKIRVSGLVAMVMLSFLYSAWIHIVIATNERGPCVPLDKYED